MNVDDLDPNPIAAFRRWLQEATAAGVHEPTAMALATAGHDGQPTVRHVLLKGFDDDGFVWFTNYTSTKGRQLDENPQAAVVFPWFAIGRQVLVTGSVTKLSPEASDAYFSTRGRDSQIGAWASPQSQVIPDRAALSDAVAAIDEKFHDEAIPRPPQWGGYRLTPATIEFWHNQPNRLHDRIRYRRTPDGWIVERLAP